MPLNRPTQAAVSLRCCIPALLAAVIALTQPGMAQEAAKPAAPDPAADGVAEPGKAALKQTGPNQYELGGIFIDAATRELRIPTEVNLQRAPVEYALVHETGKTHESVLRTAVKPTDLQTALLLAHYETGTEGLANKELPPDIKPTPSVAPKTPGTHRLTATVEWKDGRQTKQAPLSDWIQDINSRQPPPDLEVWIFNGSRVDERGFVAEHDGSMIAVYLDPNAIINSPAQGNYDDAIWISNPANIPAEGTPVTLILAPPATDKEASESKP